MSLFCSVSFIFRDGIPERWGSHVPHTSIWKVSRSQSSLLRRGNRIRPQVSARERNRLQVRFIFANLTDFKTSHFYPVVVTPLPRVRWPLGLRNLLIYLRLHVAILQFFISSSLLLDLLLVSVSITVVSVAETLNWTTSCWTSTDTCGSPTLACASCRYFWTALPTRFAALPIIWHRKWDLPRPTFIELWVYCRYCR